MKFIKTINLILLNEDKTKVLLVKRVPDHNKKVKWALPGESIKPGEKENEAIIRIIEDQLDCKPTSNFKEFKRSETRAKISVIKSQYVTGSIEGSIKLDKRKHSEFKWFDIDMELLNVEYAFNEKMIIEKLLKEYKKL